MAESVILRPLRRQDRTAWLHLWAAYNAYGQSGAPALPDEVTEATWERFFQDDAPMEALVAERDGCLIGFAHIVFHGSTSQAHPVCFLNDLFVEAAEQRKGIGRSLIEAVYARAASVGAKRVYWHVVETNAPALRLYDKVARRSGHLVYRKDL